MMAYIKPLSCLMAATIFAIAQGAGATGLPDVPNVHQGTFLPNSDSLGAALKAFKPLASARLRYENVSDDIPSSSPLARTGNAYATTLRLTLGATTGRFHGFYLHNEYEFDRHIGHDESLDLGSDFRVPPSPAQNRINAGAAIIPDNKFSEVNQALIGWRSATGGCPNSPDPCNGNTSFKLGRQQIIYNNHRWVGNIVWRQNFQTYDAFRFDNSSIKNLSLSYVYFNKVKRTFGQSSIFNEFKMKDSSMINVAYKFPDIGTLTGYGYLLDFKDNNRTPFTEGTGVAPPFVGPVIFDSKTWGARWVGKHRMGDATDLLTTFEWARQDPYKDAASFLDDNNYYNIELGVRYGGTRVDGLGLMPIGEPTFQLKAGQAVLEGNGNNAIQTPLATIHAFQGWADKFVGAPGGTATPVGGIKDNYANVEVLGLFSNIIGKNKFAVVYHNFKADKTVSGLKDYGNEWDILWAKPDFFGKKNLLGVVKYAHYNEDCDGAAPANNALVCVDTKKFWVMAQYKY